MSHEEFTSEDLSNNIQVTTICRWVICVSFSKSFV